MNELRFYLLLSGAALALIALAWEVVDPHPMAPPAPTGLPLASAATPPLREQFHNETPVLGPEPAASPELSVERRCLDLAERDPRAALELAINSHLCETDAGLLENLTAQWAARDFRAAHEWVLQQEPGEWRDGLMARVVYAFSKSNPTAAAQIAVDKIPQGPMQNEAAISVLHQWVLRDFDAAASWCAAFPPGQLRMRAMAEIEGIRRYRMDASPPLRTSLQAPKDRL